MKRFFCQCGQEVFFENSHCSICGCQLGFDPVRQQLLSIEATVTGWQSLQQPELEYRVCAHREHSVQCNWLLPIDTDTQQCISCSLTRMIPIQNRVQNVRRWSILESAKRRMLYGLLRLNLPVQADHDPLPLIFDFLEDKNSNPDVCEEYIYSGHANGVITLNAAEADSSYREATREAMNEPYRTLLGHFRHEIGHYYWEKLVGNSDYYCTFVSVFGDDEMPYREALDNHYANGPVPDWQAHFISAYASAHPLEDWAETWSHYLLMHETLETAIAFELIAKPMQQDALFDVWMNEWMQLVVVLNSISRSIGNADAYPFVISEQVQGKLRFVHDLVHNQR